MRRTQPQTTKLTPRTDTQTGTHHSASVDVADTSRCGNTTLVLVGGRENGGAPSLSDANIRNGGPQTRTRLTSVVPPPGYVYGIPRRGERLRKMWWKTKAKPTPPPTMQHLQRLQHQLHHQGHARHPHHQDGPQHQKHHHGQRAPQPTTRPQHQPHRHGHAQHSHHHHSPQHLQAYYNDVSSARTSVQLCNVTLRLNMVQ